MATTTNNTKFSAKEMAIFRKLLNSIHPDKVGDSRKEMANKLTKMANEARDRGDFATIEAMVADLASGAIWEEDKKEEAKEEAKKESKTVEIDPEILKAIKEAVEAGQYDRKKASGWILLNLSLTAKETKAYLDEIFTTTGGGSKRNSVASRFYSILEKGPITEEAFKEWIKGESKNTNAYYSHYWAIAEMANKIWSNK